MKIRNTVDLYLTFFRYKQKTEIYLFEKYYDYYPKRFIYYSLLPKHLLSLNSSPPKSPVANS